MIEMPEGDQIAAVLFEPLLSLLVIISQVLEREGNCTALISMSRYSL